MVHANPVSCVPESTGIASREDMTRAKGESLHKVSVRCDSLVKLGVPSKCAKTWSRDCGRIEALLVEVVGAAA